MTDLEKATVFLTDYDGTMAAVADDIGITAQQISNYRTGQRNLSSASYAIVHALAVKYDHWIYEQITTQPEFITFVRVMGQWFDDVIKDQHALANSDEANLDDEAVAAMIQQLNDYVTTDRSLLIRMFSAYINNLPDEE